MLPTDSLLRDRRLAALLGSILLTYLGLGVIIPIRALYAREIGLSLAGIGAMASSFLLFNTLGQVPFGWLTDRVGRKPLIVAGIAVEAAIALLYVVLAEPWTFIVLRAAEGAAAAAISPAARAYITDIAPPARRGEAFGLLGATFSGGILIGPALGGWLSAASTYQTAFIVSAAGRLMALVLVLWLVREPLTHSVRAAAAAVARWHDAVTPVLLGSYVVAVGNGFANGLFFALWSLWMADAGASLWQIGLSYTAFGLPALVLTPLAGRWGDRVGRLPLLIGPGVVEAAIYLAYPVAGSVWLIIAFSLVQGIFFAVKQPSLDGIVADGSPPDARGRVQGVYNGISLGGAFISAMLCTVLYGVSATAPFILITVVVGTTLAMGSLMLWRAGVGRTQRPAPTPAI